MKSISNIETKHSIIIRNATKNDIQKIIKEWGNAYGKRMIYKYPLRWHWQFENNPFLTSNYQNTLPVWIAIQMDKVIGWSCAMIVKGSILGHESHIAYGIDMYVKSGYRGQKIGLNLKRENQKNHKTVISIQMAKGTRRINYAIGGKPGHPLKIFLKVMGILDPSLLRESIISKFRNKKIRNIFSDFNTKTKNLEIIALSKLLSWLMKYRQGKNRNSLIKNDLNYQFEKIDRFGEEADIFWDKIKNDYGFAVNRDKTYLNWKYIQQPQMVFEKYYLKFRGEIKGLIIYRLSQKPEINYGVITEFIALNHNQQILNAMLKFAENAMKKKGVSTIRCAASTSQQENILKNNNYQIIEVKTPTIYIDSKKLPVQHDKLMKVPWLMSLGDQDLDLLMFNQQPEIESILKILRGKIPQN